MIKTFQYPAIFQLDKDARYAVSFPDLPEALTDGKDFIEAQVEARDCLLEAIQARIDDGEDIPALSLTMPGQIVVQVDLSLR